MRVVIIAHSYPRWSGDVAGSFLGRLSTALVARGHAVAVVAPAERGRGGRVVVDGIEVLQVRYAAPERETLAYHGDMGRRALTPGGAWAFLRLVRALGAGARDEVRRLDARIVHAFWWVPGGWSALSVRVPTVVSLMGTDVSMMRSLPGRLLARRVLGHAGHVTALSTYLADEVRRLTGLSRLAIERVPVPVDTERFRAGDHGRGGGIVYLGRLTGQKRVDLLLRAVQHAGLSVPVTIIGDGPARPELEALSRQLGLGGVRFLGSLPDEAVPGLLSGADVAAFPSEREGLGLAAAEAQMLGVPVVATTDGGGVLDLVRHGEGAFVVLPTPEAFGMALRDVIATPAIRESAAVAGQRLAAELAPEAVAERFERIYSRLT